MIRLRRETKALENQTRLKSFLPLSNYFILKIKIRSVFESAGLSGET